MKTRVASTIGCSLQGLAGIPVRVEADVANGLPAFVIVGLTDRAIQEARDRVRAAVRNSNFDFPTRRCTVNLAPAEVHKEGTAFDLAIAVAVLAAAGMPIRLTGTALLGELALDGSLRRVAGILPMTRSLVAHGVTEVVVPLENGPEAALVEGARVFGAPSLVSAIGHLDGSRSLPAANPSRSVAEPRDRSDLQDVRGQAASKRAIEIAAAGGHNLLMLGPPGSGKTMLAKTVPSLLPNLTAEQAIDVAAVYSLKGAWRDRAITSPRPPFRAPHHSVSRAALVGGGAGIAQPGEISLAHHGVLFLDELCEFPRTHLEALRQPLEDRSVTVGRARGSVTYPADFALVGAANPCPCGHFGDVVHACTCDPRALAGYRSRLSGPVRDRIDLIVSVPRQPFSALCTHEGAEESSGTVRRRVEQARGRQWVRGRGLNARLEGEGLMATCRLDAATSRLLADAGERMRLSARGFHRVMRVARTIADLAASEAVGPDAVREALRYRRQVPG